MQIHYVDGRGNAAVQRFGEKYEHDHGVAYSMSLPGTEEVSHVFGSWVDPDHRGMGEGDKYHKERLEHFTNLGSAKALTCIVNADNIAEKKISGKEWMGISERIFQLRWK